MYIKVYFGEFPRGETEIRESKIPSEVLVNPECPIRVIYDFLRQIFQIGSEYELDLCDESGNLCFIYEKEHWMYGLNYFVPKTSYYVVLLERDEDNRITNPLLCLPETMRKSTAQWNDLTGKIGKQLNPSLTKTGRINKTRSNSSQNK